MTRLLGVQIANRYSPEARVFAGLLRHRADAYDALVLHQDTPRDVVPAPDLFQAHSRAEISKLDFGWRSSVHRQRRTAERIVSKARFWMALPRALATAAAYDPDVIYSCQQKWDCKAATYIARRLRKPQVIHLHYSVGPWLGRGALRSLVTCDHVLAVSEFIRQDAIRYGLEPTKVTTQLNSIEVSPPAARSETSSLRAEFSIPEDAPLAGIVARISADKGQADAVAAMKQTLAVDPEARLLIVGDGPARAEVEAAVEASALGERIIFAGRRSDVHRILPSLDVFIHPSRRDPCPLAVLEAAAAGLPVVAYSDGGLPELVAEGETGLLAPAGDQKALGDALTALLTDKDRAQTMGRAARERISREFQPPQAGASFARLVSSRTATNRPGAELAKAS